jgi:hypothetical protein
METLGVKFNINNGVIDVSELNMPHDENSFRYYMHRGNRYYFKSITSCTPCKISFIYFEKLPFKYNDIVTLQFDDGKN